MQFEVRTKQGNNYIVNTESTWLWIEIERDLGYTFNQAVELIEEGSLNVLTALLHKAAKAQGHTKLPTQQAWVDNEFEGFEWVEESPKDS